MKSNTSEMNVNAAGQTEVRSTTTMNPDTNPDLITGAPGSHPIGTAIGAASVGAAGAAIGSVVPGIGTVIGGAVGAVVGAVAGAFAGHSVAEAVNPTVEDEYWRGAHSTRPYVQGDYSYETDYRPAYEYGWQSRGAYAGQSFDQADPELAGQWDQRRGQSRLEWENARHAARDAWNRVEERAAQARSELRNNLPGSDANDVLTGSKQGSPELSSSATPPPLPGTKNMSSGAKSDPSHRDTGTANV